MHNSDERCDAPTCYPETRKAVQEDILGWISDGGNEDEPKKKPRKRKQPEGETEERPKKKARTSGEPGMILLFSVSLESILIQPRCDRHW